MPINFDQGFRLASEVAYQYQQFYHVLMGILVSTKEKRKDLILLATVLKL